MKNNGVYCVFKVLLGVVFISTLAIENVYASTDKLTYENGGCNRAIVSFQSNVQSCLDDWTEELVRNLGCRIEFLPPATAPRKLKMLEEGSADLGVGFSRNSSREKKFFFSKAIHTSYYGLFSPQDDHPEPIYKLCDAAMKQYSLLALQGHYVSKELKDTLENSKCYESKQLVPSFGKRLVKMLDHHRANLLIMPLEYYNKEKNNSDVMDKLYQHPLIIKGADDSLVLSKASVSSELINHVNVLITQEKRRDLTQCLLEPSNSSRQE